MVEAMIVGGRGRAWTVGLVSLMAVLLLAGTGPAVAGGQGSAGEETTGTETACRGEVEGLLCVEVALQAEVDCAWVDEAEGVAECTSRSDWSYQAWSLALPGESEWVGSDLLHTCPPGELCRGIGVGFPYTSCTWEPVSEGCSDAFQYDHSTGAWTLEPGECLSATLTTYARAFAYAPEKDPFLGPELTEEAKLTIDDTEEICR